MTFDVSKIIKMPVVSEKSTMLSNKGQYVFVVFKNATKNEIKKAIKILYNVDVIKVNIINIHSKVRRLGRFIGEKSGYKKAIVFLKPGQKIEVLPH